MKVKEDYSYRNLQHDDFQQLIAESHQHPIVLVLVTEWLGAVDIIDMYIEDLALHFQHQIQFYRQDVEQNMNIYREIGIRQLPTTLFLKNGELVDYFSGMLNKTKIQQRLTNLIAPE